MVKKVKALQRERLCIDSACILRISTQKLRRNTVVFMPLNTEVYRIKHL